MRGQEPARDIRKKSQDTEKALFFGEVSRVWDKTSEDLDEGNIEVNVKSRSNSNEMRRIPVTCFDHSGHVVVPQEGDPIVVDFTGGRGRTPVAVASSHNEQDEHRAPNALAGHWRHEWTGDTDNVYLEAEPSDGSSGMPDLVRMGIKPDGLDAPTTEVAVDNSGSSAQITIETDGDIELNADGDILINTSSGEEPVARQNHTHNYTWTDKSGSGTTGQPNEDGTDTLIG